MIRQFPPKLNRQTACKDCDASTISPSLILDGWMWIDLVEPPDESNGWRCPRCVEGWGLLLKAHAQQQTFH